MTPPKPFAVGHVRVRPVASRGVKDGLSYWRAERYAGGKSESVWAGWATAEQALSTVARLVGGIAPTEREGTTVRDLLELWIGRQEDRRDARQLSPNTVRAQTNAAEHLVTHIGAVLCTRVDVRVLERMLAARAKEGGAPLTIQQELVALRCAWRWGRDVGHVDGELVRVSFKAEPVSEKHTPTRADVAAVLPHLVGWRRMVVELLAATGCRVGEVAALRVEDLHLVDGEMRVKGKTGARNVKLPPPTVRHLAAWVEDRSAGKLWTVDAPTVIHKLGSALTEACAAAGVRRFTPHGIRRLVRALLRRSGADASVSAGMLGHSPLVMMRYYDQVDADEEVSAMRLARLGYLTPEDEKVVELQTLSPRTTPAHQPRK